MMSLCGSTQASSGTIITIPANRIWRGTVAVSIRDAGQGKGSISVQGGGTGVSPAAGTTVMRIHCNGDGQSLSMPLTVITGDAAGTLRFDYSSLEEGTGMATGIVTKPGV
jgi:hypothetical protein